MKILITGVSKGLGRALTEEFVAAGHTVIGCGRNVQAVFDLRLTYAAPHQFDVVDVAVDSKVARWAEDVLGRHGAPDFLINNAALMNQPARLWEIEAAAFDRLMAVNVNGITNVIRYFVPAMVKAGRGVIVNFSSGWGRTGAPNVAPYCASKWAVEGLTKALAEELPAGLAAIPLSPGVINTDMLQRCLPDGAAGYPKPKVWAKTAAPFILKLGPKDNGHSLRIGGAE